MKSARLDGRIVSAYNYTPANGDVLCCADFNCAARMKFMPETIENGYIHRPAHFASHRRKEHRQGCSALQAETIQEKETLNLAEALDKKRTIIFSLNDPFGLPDSLWLNPSYSYTSKHRPETELDKFKKSRQNKITGEKGHHSVAIKSIHDLFNILAKIETQVGKAEFDNSFVTWQDITIPYSDFYLETVQRQKQLFYDLLETSQKAYNRGEKPNPWNKTDYSFPRLIRFTPSLNTKESLGLSTLLSSPIQKQQNPQNGQMILQNKIRYEPSHLNRRIFSQDCFVLAVPYVAYIGLQKRIDSYEQGNKGTTFISLDWVVRGEHQVIAAKGQTPPKPNNGNQLQLI